MTTFLHIADLHLGISQYDSIERSRDFFRAFRSVIVKYAIAEKVDFVLIAGDFFDKRVIDARTFGQAMSVLTLLKDANIPVIAIEGNHDCISYAIPVSWLQQLHGAGMITLLQSEVVDGQFIMKPSRSGQAPGSMWEYEGIRIIGTRYLGASTAKSIPKLAEAIAQLSPAPFTILATHAGLDGYVNTMHGGLSYTHFKDLEGLVHYIALGHIHQRYEVSNWIYNPSSLECCNISEFAFEHGAYLVEVNGSRHTARHISDYPRRPFHRIKYDISRFVTPEEARQAFDAFLTDELRRFQSEMKKPEKASRFGDPDVSRPVVEMTLAGTAQFNRHELEMAPYVKAVREHFSPLHIIEKNQVIPREYAVAVLEEERSLDRHTIEKRVLASLIAQDERYKPQAKAYAGLLTDLKRLALAKEKPENIYDHLAEQLNELQKVEAELPC